MEWWTHLWLNEGFATWIEYLCVDHTHPEFDIWTNFLSREYANALGLDSLSNSHPIEVRGQHRIHVGACTLSCCCFLLFFVLFCLFSLLLSFVYYNQLFLFKEVDAECSVGNQKLFFISLNYN